MPAAIFGLAGAVAGGAISTAIGGITGSIIGGIVSAGIGMLGNVLFAEDAPSQQPIVNRQSLSLNSASTVDPLPVVYGEVRIGGTRVFMHATGSDNKTLWMVFAVSEGGQALAPGSDMTYIMDELKFDQTYASDPKYGGLYTVGYHLGNDNQAADATLVAGVGDASLWGTNHRLRGVAYYWVKLLMPDPDANGYVPWGSLPNCSVRHFGRKLYDPRPGAGQDANNPATWVYSTNPALAILDYLRDPRYGKGLAIAEIDLDSFGDAASYCEDIITTPRGNIERYSLDGAVNTGNSLLNNLVAMLTACRGFLIWSAGKYLLKLDRPQLTNDFEFTEDNIIGAWSIQLGQRAQRYNRVKAHFINPDLDYKPDVAVMASDSYKTADLAEDLELDLDLPFTTNVFRAQNLASSVLKASRSLILVQFTATLDALNATAGGVVGVTHSTPGWSSKRFRVIALELQGSDDVRVTLQEYDSDAYNLLDLVDHSDRGNTTLPNPATCQPPANLALVTGNSVAIVLADGTVQARIKATWDASPDAFLDHYEIQWRIHTDTQWQSAQVGPGSLQYWVAMVEAGTSYDVRVRAVNVVGANSTWLTANTTAAGKNDPPGPVTSLTAVGKIESILLDWDNPTDADLDRIQVWASADASFAHATLVASITADSFLHHVDAGLTRYYWLRAVDTSGNVSAFTPSNAGPGTSATAAAADAGTIYDLLREVGSNTYRYSFDLDLMTREPWTDAAGGVVKNLTDTYLGDGAGLFTATGGSVAATATLPVPGEIATAWAGKRVRVTFYYKAPASNATTTGSLRLIGTGYDSGWIDVNPTGAWQAKDFVVNVAALAKDAALYVRADSLGTNKAILIDSISVQPIPDIITASNIGTWIQDAAIGTAIIADLAVSNAKIANAAITNAKIGTAAVDTLTIAGNAVTVPASAYSAGAQAISTSYTTLQSVTVTSAVASQPVYLHFTCWLGSGTVGDISITYRILRDGVSIVTFSDALPYFMAADGSGGVNGMLRGNFCYVDTPGAGTHTYTVQALKSGGTPSAYERALLALHTKR